MDKSPNLHPLRNQTLSRDRIRNKKSPVSQACRTVESDVVKTVRKVHYARSASSENPFVRECRYYHRIRLHDDPLAPQHVS
jgi:hypothetical protein